MSTYTPVDPKKKRAWPVWLLLLVCGGAAIAGLVALGQDDHDEPVLNTVERMDDRWTTGEIAVTAQARVENAVEETFAAVVGNEAGAVVRAIVTEVPVDDTPDTAVVAVVESPRPLAVTSVGALIAPANRDALVGLPVRIEGARVTEVVGDSTFYVKSATSDAGTQPVLVRLDEVPTPDTPTEGRYDVTAGQVIDIHGEVAALRGEAPDDPWLTEAEMERVPDDALYIYAERLEIVQQADAATQ